MTVERDPWREECWCPGERTLFQMRVLGHTEDCTRARRGWQANYRHLSEVARQQALDAEVGRQIREAAAEVLTSCEAAA